MLYTQSIKTLFNLNKNRPQIVAQNLCSVGSIMYFPWCRIRKRLQQHCVHYCLHNKIHPLYLFLLSSFYLVFLRWGSPYVAHAGLKLLGSSNPRPSWLPHLKIPAATTKPANDYRKKKSSKAPLQSSLPIKSVPLSTVLPLPKWCPRYWENWRQGMWVGTQGFWTEECEGTEVFRWHSVLCDC